MTTAILEMPTAKKAADSAKISLALIALQKAMATIVPAVERKTTIPVLSNVRIEQIDNAIEFVATNLDLTIRVRVATQGAVPSKPMLLPAIKLESFSKLLQGDVVTVKLVGDDSQRAEIRCGRSVTRVPNSPAASFPALSFGSGDTGVQMTQAEGERLLSFTTFAISDEESRHTLNGGLLEIADGKLSLVATDGHRLARYAVPSTEAARSVLVPAAMLRAIQKTIDGSDPALLTIDEDSAAIFANAGDHSGEIALTHRKMTGQFPNYRAVMPSKTVATIRVDADAMKAALRRALTFADERSNAIELTISGEEIRLRGASVDMGETDEAVDVVSASVGGDFAPFDIGFSGRYLVDGFSRLSGEVDMRFSALNGQTAMLIYAHPAEGETFEYVIMPMRV